MLAAASLLVAVSGCADESAGPPAGATQPSSALAALPGKADALQKTLSDDAQAPGSAGGEQNAQPPRPMGEMMSPTAGRGMMGQMPGMASRGIPSGGMPSGGMPSGGMPPAGGMPAGMAKPSSAPADTPAAKPTAMSMPRVYHMGATGFFLDRQEELSLTDSQTRQLNEVKQDALVAMATTERQIDEAEQELWTLTAEAEPDVAKIQSKTKEVGRMTVQRRMGFIRAVGKATGLLSADQRQVVARRAKASAADETASGKMGGMGKMGDAKKAKMANMADAKKAKMADMADAKRAKMAETRKAKMGKMGGANKPKMGKMGSAKKPKMGKMAGADKPKMGKMAGANKPKMAQKGMAMMGKNPAPASMAKMSLPSSLPGFPGASHLYHVGATDFFLDHAESLALTDEQRAKLEQIKKESTVTLEAAEAKIEKAERELWTFTASAEPDDSKLKAKLEEIAQLFVERRMAFIRSVGDAAKLLSDEQRTAVVGQSPR